MLSQISRQHFVVKDNLDKELLSQCKVQKKLHFFEILAWAAVILML